MVQIPPLSAANKMRLLAAALVHHGMPLVINSEGLNSEGQRESEGLGPGSSFNSASTSTSLFSVQRAIQVCVYVFYYFYVIYLCNCLVDSICLCIHI